MSDDAAIRALAWFFDSHADHGFAEAGTGAAEPVFFNARPLPASLTATLADHPMLRQALAVQPHRPLYLALRNAGWQVTADRSAIGSQHGGAIVVLDRTRALNEAWLKCTAKSVIEGGIVVIAGTRTDGVDALRKRLQKSGCAVETLAKHHAKVLRVTMDASTHAAFNAFEDRPEAGLFNAGQMDRGSQILAQNLSQDAGGRLADFCSGSGLLARSIIERGNCTSADLFEANHDAVVWSREHVHFTDCPVAVHWHDLVAEPVEQRFDTIVMNPPFHTGRAATPDLGQAIIRRAAQSLKSGGRLHMVANVALPYEATLGKNFRGFQLVATQSGFKVLEAWT